MLCQQTFSDGSWNIRTTAVNGVAYFCGKDICASLGFKNSNQALKNHAFEEDRLILDPVGGPVAGGSVYSCRSMVWVGEASLYHLIFRSPKEEAQLVRRWVCGTIIPWYRHAIRDQSQAPLCLQNETDLHYKIVQAIRRFFTHALLAPGLGELQDNSDKRTDAWKKGYRAGTPDILILKCHKKYNGFCDGTEKP